MDNWDKIEFGVLVLTISIGAIISISDLLGIFDNIIWLKQRIPSLTLFLVTLISLSLLIGLYSTKYFLKTAIPRETTRQFDDTYKLINYVIYRMKSSKKCFYRVNLMRHKGRSILNETEYDEYINAIIDISKRSKYKYGEIVSLYNQFHVDRAKKLLNKTGENYELAIYRISDDPCPPIWSFLIIDDEELILLKERISTKNPKIVKYYTSYYNELWKNATTIKSGSRKNFSILDEIEKEQEGIFLDS
ncbi:MAG: hypothetical protein D3908_08200 [Candidatus Electrothrix sp. AUS4]|nr:hypothetical protein [Candidatus Electrothrix sp. AUS4]